MSGIYNLLKVQYDSYDSSYNVGATKATTYTLIGVAAATIICFVGILIFFIIRKPEKFGNLQRQIIRTVRKDSHEDAVKLAPKSDPFW